MGFSVLGFASDIFGFGGDAPGAPSYQEMFDIYKDVVEKQKEIYGWSEDQAKSMIEKFDEQYQFAKQQGLDDLSLAKQLSTQSQLMSNESYQDYLKEKARYYGTFAPIEQSIAESAMTYDTPERRQQEMARAQADVKQRMEAERSNAAANLEGYGIDPSQTRQAALDLGYRAQQVAQQTQAAETARQQVEAEGQMRKLQAAGIGQGIAARSQQLAGLSLGAGQQALGQGLAGSQSARQWAALPLGYAGAAQQGLAGWGAAAAGMGNTATQWGNMQNTAYQNQMQKWGAEFARDQASHNAIMDIWGGIAGSMAPGADGGAIPMADGTPPGMVQGYGDGTGIDDQVPAALSKGEYVIPADVVKTKGTEFFDKLLEKYHTPADVQRQQMGIPPQGVPPQGPPPGAIPMADGWMGGAAAPAYDFAGTAQGQLPMAGTPQAYDFAGTAQGEMQSQAGTEAMKETVPEKKPKTSTIGSTGSTPTMLNTSELGNPQALLASFFPG